MSMKYRIERDSMGEVRIPADALYGPQTQRALENFPISGLRFQRTFLRALGLIKSAAAKVNGRIGELTPELAAKVEAAAEEVIAGAHDGQFAVDIFQTGSGTSTNMNVNEVIAKLAGAHPNDHFTEEVRDTGVGRAAPHTDHPLAELDDQRLVEAEPLAFELDGLLRDAAAVAAQLDLDHVAWNDPQHEEHKHRHAEQRGDHQQHAVDGVAEHGSGTRSRLSPLPNPRPQGGRG